jgi:hypothetical protein
MAGEEFLHAVQQTTASGGHFGHREHLELTWEFLERYDFPRATEEICAGLRRVATAHGQPERYHDTITRFWIQLMDHSRRCTPTAQTFEQLLQTRPFLLEKGLIERHWSRDALFVQPESRAAWVEPDIRPLPPR